MKYFLIQLEKGRECISHYSNLRRFCVFSHDELVCKMSLEPESLDIGIATATYHDMLKMVEDEKKLRKNLLEWVSIWEKLCKIYFFQFLFLCCYFEFFF